MMVGVTMSWPMLGIAHRGHIICKGHGRSDTRSQKQGCSTLVVRDKGEVGTNASPEESCMHSVISTSSDERIRKKIPCVLILNKWMHHRSPARRS
jgi:hypothetical protein